MLRLGDDDGESATKALERGGSTVEVDKSGDEELGVCRSGRQPPQSGLEQPEQLARI